MKKVILVCCLHGNEGYGFEVCRKQSLFPFVLANKKAKKENKRFVDVDLNRCFPGKFEGNHEERIANYLNLKLKRFDYVIDMHSSSNYCPMFGIITKPNKEKIEFAKKLGLKKLVIMPESFASGKSLIDFVKCGISLEIGPHNGKENVKEALDLIDNFANEKNYNPDIEILEVFQVIKKENSNILINNFDNVLREQVISQGNGEQKADFDFTAVLVNEEAYNGVLCLACKKYIVENLK